jgi:hypothetical protein
MVQPERQHWLVQAPLLLVLLLLLMSCWHWQQVWQRMQLLQRFPLLLAWLALKLRLGQSLVQVLLGQKQQPAWWLQQKQKRHLPLASF